MCDQGFDYYCHFAGISFHFSQLWDMMRPNLEVLDR